MATSGQPSTPAALGGSVSKWPFRLDTEALDLWLPQRDETPENGQFLQLIPDKTGLSRQSNTSRQPTSALSGASDER